MMQAIVTKFIGPTNYRGQRVTAKCAAKKITMGWQCELGIEENHIFAAKALISEMNWAVQFERFYGGSMPDNSAYCFVAVPKRGRK